MRWMAWPVKTSLSHFKTQTPQLVPDRLLQSSAWVQQFKDITRLLLSENSYASASSAPQAASAPWIACASFRIEAVSAPYRCYVIVSRWQIALNYRNVRSVVGPDVEVAGVIKADAYGHGAVEVSRVLAAEGAKWLAVSSVEEGAGLRRGGIHQARILVMGGFLPYEGDALVEHQLTPVVHALDQMGVLDQCGRALGKPIPFHLKIDS